MMREEKTDRKDAFDNEMNHFKTVYASFREDFPEATELVWSRDSRAVGPEQLRHFKLKINTFVTGTYKLEPI